MTFSQLRLKHPEFIYDSFSVDREKDQLKIQFRFRMAPDILFFPRVNIPWPENATEDDLSVFVFNLGLVELFSYWKSACSPLIRIRAGYLSPDQIGWWKTFLLQGMGEFFYSNGIDFRAKDFVQFKVESDTAYKPVRKELNDKVLVLVGGGKDSAVTLELLKRHFSITGLFLNPSQAAQKTLKLSGVDSFLRVKRVIDPTLLNLNKRGYLNGHTPFSGYLAFLATLVSFGYGCKQVVVSNERSANEVTTTFLGKSINHQYSKSGEFERKFREYVGQYLSNSSYFSLLRPLYELQIGKLFSQFSQYHQVFRSCNVGQKDNRWCGRCSKCLFVYLTLSAFLSKKAVETIFGTNMLDSGELFSLLLQMVGKDKNKPFECVGTIEETKIALYLTIEKYLQENLSLPKLLQLGQKEIIVKEKDWIERSRRLLRSWDTKNFLPREFESVLREVWHERIIG